MTVWDISLYTNPTPPLTSFSVLSSVAGDMRSPLMATASPFSNSISKYVGWSGAFCGGTETITFDNYQYLV